MICRKGGLEPQCLLVKQPRERSKEICFVFSLSVVYHSLLHDRDNPKNGNHIYVLYSLSMKYFFEDSNCHFFKCILRALDFLKTCFQLDKFFFNVLKS